MVGDQFPKLCESFPDLVVETTQGTFELPKDYRGEWFVLFSHPGDFTPVCTTEFIAFANRSDEFKQLNTKLIGLSVDQAQSHLKWIEWINTRTNTHIPFPIIADPLGNVSKQLGMIQEAKGTNTVRAVFIVDDRGIVRLIMYYPQEIGRNIDELLRSIRALQTSDELGVAIPADWPKNNLIGDKVILPPASTEEMVRKRLESAKDGTINCFDWWFCYKEIK
ncbi:peroxiredoxin [Haloplasma contractile]|uniref:Peroxiredoxin n=1 Tax=Haloplasma contractile SSD-17B TaxID=1033810 RepID=U2FDY4_9MOLU|nr:peroxiredoxin [Haloplasma contractile]ERJ11190.1 Peroxiredoxin Posttranslational modification protein [Haloplasma contractile SSD-17B]